MTDRTDIAAFLWAAFGFSPDDAEEAARRLLPDDEDKEEEDWYNENAWVAQALGRCPQRRSGSRR